MVFPSRSRASRAEIAIQIYLVREAAKITRKRVRFVKGPFSGNDEEEEPSGPMNRDRGDYSGKVKEVYAGELKDIGMPSIVSL